MGNYNWLTFAIVVFVMALANLKFGMFRKGKCVAIFGVTIDVILVFAFFLTPFVNSTVMDKWFNFSLLLILIVFLSIEFVLAGFPKKYTIPILVIVDIAALWIAIHKIF